MKKELTKEERIKREERRLNRIFKDIDPKKKNIIPGLVQRAAHLRIMLDDLAQDLDENGYVESFQQGKDNPPYDRKRPAADLYTTTNTVYQKVIKQLTDLLPKEDKSATAAKADPISEFEAFVVGRDD